MRRQHQQGMTAIGAILLLAVFGLIAFGVLQLVPVYLESFKIQQVLNSVKTEMDGQNASVTEVRKSLGKRVDIEDLREVDYKKDFVISRSKGGYLITTKYSRKRPYVANLYLLAEFEYTVEITK